MLFAIQTDRQFKKYCTFSVFLNHSIDNPKTAAVALNTDLRNMSNWAMRWLIKFRETRKLIHGSIIQA